MLQENDFFHRSDAKKEPDPGTGSAKPAPSSERGKKPPTMYQLQMTLVRYFLKNFDHERLKLSR